MVGVATGCPTCVELTVAVGVVTNTAGDGVLDWFAGDVATGVVTAEGGVLGLSPAAGV
jgi:hypothetical protein